MSEALRRSLTLRELSVFYNSFSSNGDNPLPRRNKKFHLHKCLAKFNEEFQALGKAGLVMKVEETGRAKKDYDTYRITGHGRNLIKYFIEHGGDPLPEDAA